MSGDEHALGDLIKGMVSEESPAMRAILVDVIDDRVRAIEAERDRLRAVVDAAPGIVEKAMRQVRADHGAPLAGDPDTIRDHVRVALAQLDVSAKEGDVSDDAYTSPVDGHLHYGIRARQECAVCTLELTAQSALNVLRDFAERVATAAGVSLTWDEGDQVGEPGTPKYNDRLISDVEAAMAGRDRLRAVVERFVAAARANDWANVLCDGRFDALEDALDGTDDMGGSETGTGSGSDPPLTSRQLAKAAFYLRHLAHIVTPDDPHYWEVRRLADRCEEMQRWLTGELVGAQIRREGEEARRVVLEELREGRR